jgi:hypothetical protein
LKIKLKTGRPSNVRKDPAQEEAFKKTLQSWRPLMISRISTLRMRCA